MAAPIGPILMIARRVFRMVSREQRRRNRASGSGGSGQQPGSGRGSGPAGPAA